MLILIKFNKNISFNYDMVRPKGHTFLIFLCIKIYSGPPMLFPQTIPHHSYWVHGTLLFVILWFNTDNSIVIIIRVV